MADTNNKSGEVLTEAIALSQVCKDIDGKYVQHYDLRQHPELTENPYPYVFEVLRNEINFFKTFKDKLRENTSEDIDKLVKGIYKSYKKFLGKSPLDIPEDERAQLRERFAREHLKSTLADLKVKFNKELLYRVEDKEAALRLDEMWRLFLAPEGIENNTSYVYLSNPVFGDSDICLLHKNISHKEIEAFRDYYHDADISKFSYLYIPFLGFRWVKNEFINNNIFALSASERYHLVAVMCRNDNQLIRRYAKVLAKQPFDTEYHLFRCYRSRNNLEYTKQYFEAVLVKIEGV